MQYSDSKSVAHGRITAFSIQSLVNDATVWDITDPFECQSRFNISQTGDNITFKSATDTLKTFIAFTTGNALVPSIKPVPVPNQDLHSSAPADMIIINPSIIQSIC